MKILFKDSSISIVKYTDLLNCIEQIKPLVDLRLLVGNDKEKGTNDRRLLSNLLNQSDITIAHEDLAPNQNDIVIYCSEESKIDYDVRFAYFISASERFENILNYYRSFIKTKDAFLITSLFPEELESLLGLKIESQFLKRIIFIPPRIQKMHSIDKDVANNNGNLITLFFDQALASTVANNIKDSLQNIENFAIYKLSADYINKSKVVNSILKSKKILVFTQNTYLQELIITTALKTNIDCYSWEKPHLSIRRLLWNNINGSLNLIRTVDEYSSIREFFRELMHTCLDHDYKCLETPFTPDDYSHASSELLSAELSEKLLCNTEKGSKSILAQIFDSSPNYCTSEDLEWVDSTDSVLLSILQSIDSCSKDSDKLKNVENVLFPIIRQWILRKQIYLSQKNWWLSYRFFRELIPTWDSIYKETLESAIKTNAKLNQDIQKCYLYYLGVNFKWDEAKKLITSQSAKFGSFNDFLVGMWGYHDLFRSNLNPKIDQKSSKDIIKKSLVLWKYDIDNNLGDHNAPACWYALYGILHCGISGDHLSFFDDRNRNIPQFVLQYIALPLTICGEYLELTKRLEFFDQSMIKNVFSYKEFERFEIMSLLSLVFLVTDDIQKFDYSIDQLIIQTLKFNLNDWTFRKSTPVSRNTSLLYLLTILKALKLSDLYESITYELELQKHKEITEDSWLIDYIASKVKVTPPDNVLDKIKNYFS